VITIRDIDHVVLRVNDLDAMVAFYRDILGARLEKAQSDIGLYQLRVGNALIDLAPADAPMGRMGGDAPGREGHNVDHIAFRVAPWDGQAILAHLAANGIAGEITSRYGAEGYGPSIYLVDPEGNGLELKGPPWPDGSAGV